MEFYNQLLPNVQGQRRENSGELKKITNRVLDPVVDYVRKNPDDKKAQKIIQHVNMKIGGGAYDLDNIITGILALAVVAGILHMFD